MKVRMGRVASRLKVEAGFTLTEILVAGLIISVALIPLVNMFDTSFKGILNYERIHEAYNCARATVERIRSMPYYEPYNPSRGDVDIDDHFWGDRTPIFDNPENPAEPGAPSWDSIPEVSYFDYGEVEEFRNFKATVQLAYLNTDTGVARMSPEWGPKKIGNDRPRNLENEVVHLLLIKVNVYWPPGRGDRSYSLEQVVTDTDTIYNVGVSRVVVVGPESVKDPERENAAAHYPNETIILDIYGYGFKEGEGLNKPKGLNAYLVRNKYNDIPITLEKPPTLYAGETYAGNLAVDQFGNMRVRGRVTLYNNGTSGVLGEPNFYPRAAVGYWSVRIAQEEIINSYLFNGFIVEYPRPKIEQFGNDPDMSLSGRNDESAKQLKIVGRNFITMVKNPTPALVLYSPSGEILDQVLGVVNSISGTVNNGYSESLQTMLATFDLTKASPGVYKLVIYNTDPGLIGHVGSQPSQQEYTVIAVPPVVADIYVEGTYPRMRLAYKNIDFGKIRLAIDGMYFNALEPYVEVYISDSATENPRDGSWAQGTLVSVSKTKIVADFDVTQLPAKDNAYNAFVLNLDSGLWGKIESSSPRLSVRTYNGSISDFEPTSEVLFWENYYDIPSRITGSGLDACIAIGIHKDGTEYRDIEYTVVDSSRIDVNLNLIDCPSGTWELRVYITPNYYLKKNFQVSLGKAVILNPQRAYMYALSIDRRVKNASSYTTDYEYEYYQWGSWRVHRAEAIRSGYTKREARFTVRGKGFPVSGTTTLRVWRSDSWSKEGYYTTRTDRSRKFVYIVSDWWEMPNLTGYCGISVLRTGDDSNSTDVHEDRWELVNP